MTIKNEAPGAPGAGTDATRRGVSSYPNSTKSPSGCQIPDYLTPSEGAMGGDTMTAEDVEIIAYRNPIEALGFAKVSHVLTHFNDLSDGAFRLYCLLIEYAQQNSQCWPGEERLAEDLSVSRPTIARRFVELAALELITRERRVGTSSITWIEPLEKCEKLLPIVSNMIQRRIKNDTTVVSEMIRKEEQENKNKTTTTTKPVVVAQLSSLGIAEKDAKEWAELYPLDRISEVIAASAVATENRAGWIRKALVEGWQFDTETDRRKAEQSKRSAAIVASLRHDNGGDHHG